MYLAVSLFNFLPYVLTLMKCGWEAKRAKPLSLQQGANCIYCSGLAVAGSPISTNDVELVYFNTMIGLAYIDNRQEICLTEFSNHFNMVFDPTSTKQISRDFTHSELTNCSISIELNFAAA